MAVGLNFGRAQIEHKTPTGGKYLDKAYTITRDGFTILAMGYTGSKAMKFKLAYIDAFNRMEAALRGQDPSRNAADHHRRLRPAMGAGAPSDRRRA